MSSLKTDIVSVPKHGYKDSAIIYTIVGIIFLGCAIYCIFNRYIQVNATILTATCTQSQPGSPYNCILNVSYNVNNKIYFQQITVDNNTPYSMGQSIQIYYSPNNLDTISPSGSSVSITLW